MARPQHLPAPREGGSPRNGSKERAEPPEANAIWDVPGDTGRRYASVSGDRNPIHLHGLSARLFGQPGAIAHGMWSKARCLAALEGHLPEAFTVEVSFKLPVRLPAKVAFSSSHEGAERRFALHDARSGKPHLEGSAQLRELLRAAGRRRSPRSASPSRRSRVSGRFALTTHHVAILR